uniref:Syntaxin-7 n=1 Tax=Lygus hesperus TaxID=30085 RepID=A0A0A9YWG5_LYGHE
MAFNQNYGSINAERVPNVGFSGGPRSDTDKQMSDLADSVSKKIFQLSQDIKSLEQSQKLLGTPKDSQAIRNKIQNVESNINNTVKLIATDLAVLKKYARGKQPMKLQIEKLTDDFKTTVEICSKAQKAALEKLRTTYLPSEVAAMDASPTVEGGASYLQAGQTTAELRQATASLEFETGLLREREQRIAHIEKNIIDVNQIMNELGAMVNAQADDINSIDNAIERTQVDVELAAQELEKGANYMTRRRKKNCFLLSIAVIAVIILVIVIVVSLH